jgi:hypothetical protein
MHKIVLLAPGESVWEQGEPAPEKARNSLVRRALPCRMPASNPDAPYAALHVDGAQSDLNRRAKHWRLKFISWGSL